MAEVHVIGQITRLSDFEEGSYFVRWNTNSGSYWKVVEGFAEGQTHLSASKFGANELIPTNACEDTNPDRNHWFNHPIDIHFHTNGIQGWPTLEFQIWSVDWLKKCNVSAYGFLAIPSQAGHHKLTCATWRPVGNFRRRLIDYLSGYRMQLMNPSSIIGNGSNRHVIQTESMGSVEAEVNIVLKDFDKYGIDLSRLTN